MAWNFEGCSLETMYEAFYPRLYNYIFYKLLDHKKTEDVLSAVMLSAVLRGGPRDRGETLETWIFQLADGILSDYEAGRSVHSDGRGKEIISTKRQEIFRQLSAMTEKERRMAYFLYFEGRSREELETLMKMDGDELADAMASVQEKLSAVQE